MFLKHTRSGHLIEIADVTELTNPCVSQVTGFAHWGEEVQAAEAYDKHELQFTSGEHLPQCWMDAHFSDYRVTTSRPWPEAEADGYHGA